MKIFLLVTPLSGKPRLTAFSKSGFVSKYMGDCMGTLMLYPCNTCLMQCNETQCTALHYIIEFKKKNVYKANHGDTSLHLRGFMNLD